jgi:hypothetical protein
MPDWSIWQWLIAIAAVWLSLAALLALSLFNYAINVCGGLYSAIVGLRSAIEDCSEKLESIGNDVDSIRDDVHSLEGYTVPMPDDDDMVPMLDDDD